MSFSLQHDETQRMPQVCYEFDYDRHESIYLPTYLLIYLLTYLPIFYISRYVHLKTYVGRHVYLPIYQVSTYLPTYEKN